MGKRVTVVEAAAITGLSVYALRKGIKERRYPHIRTGIGSGKIIIDIELLERSLEQEAFENIGEYAADDNTSPYGVIRCVPEKLR